MFGADEDTYWTSSVDADDSADAWSISFYRGYVGTLEKAEEYAVRCVRSTKQTN